MKSRKCDKNGQSSLEFFILVFIALSIFLGLLFIVQINIGERIADNLNREVNDLALNVQNEINLAVASSDGYVREFVLPEKIANLDYEINISSDMVYVRTKDNRFACSYPVQKVKGDVQKGINVIKKVGEEVFLN